MATIYIFAIIVVMSEEKLNKVLLKTAVVVNDSKETYLKLCVQNSIKTDIV